MKFHYLIYIFQYFPYLRLLISKTKHAQVLQVWQLVKLLIEMELVLRLGKFDMYNLFWITYPTT